MNRPKIPTETRFLSPLLHLYVQISLVDHHFPEINQKPEITPRKSTGQLDGDGWMCWMTRSMTQVRINADRTQGVISR
jgi:hypothetical protein